MSLRDRVTAVYHPSVGIAGGERLLDRFGLLESRFWGRRTAPSRLGLHRNITLGVTGHRRRLGLGEQHFWGRCTIIIESPGGQNCIAWGRISLSATYVV